tara:strand:- start:4392 stop:4613 length:222 start_codon:yes stop_codon:yes gene_type:complete
MIKYILLTFFCFTFGQVYNVGQTMSNSHQNITHSVCYGETDYGSSNTLRFADYNGDLNGGDYHVIFVDMSASW